MLMGSLWMLLSALWPWVQLDVAECNGMLLGTVRLCWGIGDGVVEYSVNAGYS